MTDHRDSQIADDEPARRLADDLLLDAILAGRAEDTHASIRARVSAATRTLADDTDGALPFEEGRHRGPVVRRRSLAAAAAVLLATGLLALIFARPTPAFATVDESLRRLETRNLTFMLSLAPTAETTDASENPPERLMGRVRRLDGATLHVQDDRSVLVSRDRGGRVLARGFDGSRFWSNYGPEAIEASGDMRNERGMGFMRFLDAVDGDMKAMIRGLRRGHRVAEMDGPNPDEEPGWRHFRGVRRVASDRTTARRGGPSAFEVSLDEIGEVRRLRLLGLSTPDGRAIGDLTLELIDDAPVEDAVFDPDHYERVDLRSPRRPGPPRGRGPESDQRGRQRPTTPRTD